MNRLHYIHESLDDFAQRFLGPNVTTLRFQNATIRSWSDDEYKRLRLDGFPSRTRGVYALFNKEESLEYIGVATGCFDKRVWDHDTVVDRWYVDVLSLDDDHIYLAPSIEYWLITKLKPPKNKAFSTHS